jgi:transposase
MAYHLALAGHLSTDQLRQRYRAATDPVERSHYHLVWLKSQGRTTPEVAATTGYSENWVRTIIHRYNAEGERGLADRRHGNGGAEPMLDAQQRADLEAALERGRAPDGGPWTGPKVARWIEQATGREAVHDQRGWDYLIRLGFSAQTPRPRHEGADPAAEGADPAAEGADPAAQAAFKKHAG